ncbi:MAG: hypothetical protein EHM45_03270 [Desulfobacteraceae bacterium]|nr:MAG: hypothetical protein EHM45_03270 [Desulfobacteraceae bacterium]
MKIKLIKAIIGFFMLLCFVSLAGAEAVVLTFDGGSIVMPAEPGEPFDNEVSLPWGKAIQRSYQAFDPTIGTMFLFATFEFKNPKKSLDKIGLRKVRAYFLRSHGCTAEVIMGKELRDASGAIWPQTMFGGVCKAPERYQITVLIAQRKLYLLQVYRNMFNNPQAEKMPMNETLRRFAAGFKPAGE